MEKIFRKLFLIFLILQIFSGCQKKENDYLPVLSENNFTQEQAQAWFGSEDISYFTLKRAMQIQKPLVLNPIGVILSRAKMTERNWLRLACG